jgi:hypothetical protein
MYVNLWHFTDKTEGIYPDSNDDCDYFYHYHCHHYHFHNNNNENEIVDPIIEDSLIDKIKYSIFEVEDITDINKKNIFKVHILNYYDGINKKFVEEEDEDIECVNENSMLAKKLLDSEINDEFEINNFRYKLLGINKNLRYIFN